MRKPAEEGLLQCVLGLPRRLLGHYWTVSEPWSRAAAWLCRRVRIRGSTCQYGSTYLGHYRSTDCIKNMASGTSRSGSLLLLWALLRSGYFLDDHYDSFFYHVRHVRSKEHVWNLSALAMLERKRTGKSCPSDWADYLLWKPQLRIGSAVGQAEWYPPSLLSLSFFFLLFGLVQSQAMYPSWRMACMKFGWTVLEKINTWILNAVGGLLAGA